MQGDLTAHTLQVWKAACEYRVSSNIRLDVDPKEEKPYDDPYLHSRVMVHAGMILPEDKKSIEQEPLIPAGAPVDFVPFVFFCSDMR